MIHDTRTYTAASARSICETITVLLFAAVLGVIDGRDARADRIVLRNLTIISDRTAVSLDEDGVRLDDGATVTWDEIETGSIAEPMQAKFDLLLKELGGPLYLIRQRLKVGDYESLLDQAEAVYPRYRERRSPTAYMVCQALMWSRLATGRREAAVEPYLRCYEYLRATRSDGSGLPGERRLEFDAKTALSPSLVPVWFDPNAAKSALPDVIEVVKSMSQPRPAGVYIYLATLAQAAGDRETAERMLGAVGDGERAAAEWRQIVLAQFEIADGKSGAAVQRLEADVDKLLSQNRPAAVYWLGMLKVQANDPQVRRDGVLEFLRLPALYGKQFPELAGAGLYQAMLTLDELKDVKGSVAVRRELLVRYSQTVHAAKLKVAKPTPTNP